MLSFDAAIGMQSMEGHPDQQSAFSPEAAARDRHLLTLAAGMLSPGGDRAIVTEKPTELQIYSNEARTQSPFNRHRRAQRPEFPTRSRAPAYECRWQSFCRRTYELPVAA